MDFSVQVLGYASATPLSNRFTSSQIVTFNQQPFLVDCGEGTQILLRKYKVRFSKIDHIFISHLHGDHFLGLVGLLSSFHLLGRKKELKIYGPKGIKEIIEVQLKHSETSLTYTIQYIFLEDCNDLLIDNALLSIRKIPLNHRISCWGFVFTQKNGLANLKPGVVEAYGIPYAEINKIKSGEDFVKLDGTKVKNELLTFPLSKSISYAYCSDNRIIDKTLPLLDGIDYLYHEATFLHELLNRAKKTFHSTAKEVGELAKKLKLKRLFVGHFSARYIDLSPIKEEIESEFSAVTLVEEGEIYKLQ